MVVAYADPAVAAFVLIPSALVAMLVWGTARAWRRSGSPPETVARVSFVVGAAAVLWMATTWMVAQRGILLRWEGLPPPFGILIVAIVLLAAIIAFSPLGRRLAQFLPLWSLVAVQGFRLPLELAMHTMYERGIMPQQMSYSGQNFDIVTGVTAITVAAIVATGRDGRRLVAVWNVMGLALLINIVVVAVLSTPTFRYFGEDRLNVWIAYAPFVWLPSVMVLAALAGHLVIFSALRFQDRDRAPWRSRTERVMIVLLSMFAGPWWAASLGADAASDTSLHQASAPAIQWRKTCRLAFRKIRRTRGSRPGLLRRRFRSRGVRVRHHDRVPQSRLRRASGRADHTLEVSRIAWTPSESREVLHGDSLDAQTDTFLSENGAHA